MGFIEINQVLKKTFEKTFTREKIRNTLMNYQLLHEKRLEIHLHLSQFINELSTFTRE